VSNRGDPITEAVGEGFEVMLRTMDEIKRDGREWKEQRDELLVCLKEAARDFRIMRYGARMKRWEAAIARCR
jgi:hypothetical protein